MGKKDNEAAKRSWIKSKFIALRPGKSKGKLVYNASQQSSSPASGGIDANIPIIQNATPPEKQIHAPKTMALQPKKPHRAANEYIPDQENTRAGDPNIETPRSLNVQVGSQDFTPAPPKQPEQIQGIANASVYQVLQANGFDLRSKNPNLEKALLWAIENGQEHAVKVLLMEGANVRMIDEVQETFLHKAAYTPYERVLQILLCPQIDKNARNTAGRTALHIAAANGREELLRRLINAGADLFAKTSQQSSALDLAIESEDERTVHRLLEKGLEAPLCIGGGEDEFQRRKASDGLYAVAQLLVAHGIEFRERSGSERSALHVMAEKGQVDGVRLLLKRGSDVATVDKLDQCAVHFAAKGGQRKTIQILLDHHAATTKDLPYLQQQKARKAIIHAKDSSKRTPLYHAIMNGHVEVTRYLLKEGANHMTRDSKNHTAMYWADQNGHDRVLYALRAHEDQIRQNNPKLPRPLVKGPSSSENWSAHEAKENMIDPMILRWD